MLRIVLAAMIVLYPSLAHGQGVGLQASSLGLGIEAQTAPLGGLALRGGANALSFSPDHTIDGIKYDTDIELKSAGAVVDWYPGLGGFHLSGGLRLNGNNVDLAAMPTQPVQVGGTTYAPGQVGRLSGQADFNRFAPYLGVGWQGAVMGGRMLIGLDFGALYQGKPDVRLTATGAGATPGLADDLAREARAIEDDLGGFRFFPVISLTFTYRF